MRGAGYGRAPASVSHSWDSSRDRGASTDLFIRIPCSVTLYFPNFRPDTEILNSARLKHFGFSFPDSARPGWLKGWR